jgi:phosphatidate cytidylyltransferase
MLKQRVITALILLVVLLLALSARNPWPFMVLTVAMIAAGAWEAVAHALGSAASDLAKARINRAVLR